MGTDVEEPSNDEQVVRRLDESWNDIYVRDDRPAFQKILADDFCGMFADGRPITKADLMRPSPPAVRLTFSEHAINMFAPTAVTRGRVFIEHRDRAVDQRFVRVYCKRASGWQAVAVYVFPPG